MAQSYHTWREGVDLPKFERLAGSQQAEVTVIGGGLCGVLSAYLLAKAGKRVILLEKDKLAAQATDATTAFLTQVIDTDFSDMISAWGETEARLITESHARAIDQIEKIIAEENINCEFTRTTNYIYAATEKEFAALQEEAAAARRLGVEANLFQDNKLGFNNAGYLAIPGQAKFHPHKFLAAVARAAVQHGAVIYEQSEALDIKNSGSQKVVETADGAVTADWVIAATYEPFQQPPGLYFKKGLYISYVFELALPNNVIPEGIYEDTKLPYHYFRIDPQTEHASMIIGGEDHRQDIKVSEGKNYTALQEQVDQLLGDTQYEIISKWSGPILEPVDGLAFIGPHEDPRVLYAFGFSGNGMTYSMLAADINTDRICNKTNLYQDLYAASRTPGAKSLLFKGKDYVQELFGGAFKNMFKRKQKEEE